MASHLSGSSHLWGDDDSLEDDLFENICMTQALEAKKLQEQQQRQQLQQQQQSVLATPRVPEDEEDCWKQQQQQEQPSSRPADANVDKDDDNHDQQDNNVNMDEDEDDIDFDNDNKTKDPDYDHNIDNDNDNDDYDGDLFDDDDFWQDGQGFDLASLPLSPPQASCSSGIAPSTAAAAAAASPPCGEPSKKRKLDNADPQPPAMLQQGEKKKPSPQHNVTSTPMPDLATVVSWSDLFREHAALIESKGKVNARRFNKTALEMLNSCIGLARQGLSGGIVVPPATSRALSRASSSAHSSSSAAPLASAFPETAEWASEKASLIDFRTLLLNTKELASEDLVQRVCQYIQQGLPPLLTADEKKEQLLRRSLAFLQELGPALSIKTAPIVKSHVSRLFDSQLDSLFAEIRMPEMSLRDKALVYRRMLFKLLDDDHCVMFAATNRLLLGKLDPADLWFLTFFAFVTTRRVRGDNLLQLGCVGKSSVGKSLLFESIILTTGHQLLSSSSSGSGDAGVGRFSCGSKNAVVFHDINIATLVGADVEKVKSLARSENTIAKIHSSTTALSPMFVLYTSNERLFRHTLPLHISASGFSRIYHSQVEDSKKPISPENLEAVRARFLEMFVFKAPRQDPRDLEKCTNFSREHFILATYFRAFEILEKHAVEDFPSAYLPAYALSALAKNLDFIESVMGKREGFELHRTRLERLQAKFKIVF